MGDISIDDAVKDFKLIDDDRTIKCVCEYPCQSNLCPKVQHPQDYSQGMCHMNYCEVIEEYSNLTYSKNYCSKCGRKLK